SMFSPDSSRGSTRTSTKRTSSRITTWGSRSRRWGCSTRRSPNSRRRCARPRASSGRPKRWASASLTRAPMSWPSRSCGAGSSCPRRAIRSDSASCTGSAGRSRSREKRWRRGTCTAGRSPWISASRTSAPGRGRSPRRSDVSQQVAPVALADIQRPVASELERVAEELRRIIAADFPIIAEVNEHLLRMKGKLFRPTLLLLSHRASGADDPRTVTLAAVVELIHLATLVHDDSVDHSVLRRGMPTLRAPAPYREALARFGLRLGMAFQITDDLLDYTEREAVTGKPSGLDLKEHKVTLPLIAALAAMGPTQRRRVGELMATPDPGDPLVAEVMQLVET